MLPLFTTASDLLALRLGAVNFTFLCLRVLMCEMRLFHRCLKTKQVNAQKMFRTVPGHSKCPNAAMVMLLLFPSLFSPTSLTGPLLCLVFYLQSPPTPPPWWPCLTLRALTYHFLERAKSLSPMLTSLLHCTSNCLLDTSTGIYHGHLKLSESKNQVHCTFLCLSSVLVNSITVYP